MKLLIRVIPPMLACAVGLSVGAAALAQPCAPQIIANPQPVGTCTGYASFSVTATSESPMGYRWEIQTSPGVWQAMTTNPFPLPCMGGYAASLDPFSSSTTIVLDPCVGVSQYQIRAEVLNVCGDTFSAPATLTFNSADFNGDGDTGTDADIEAFFACLAGDCCATCGSADFNGDGDVGTDADIEAFFNRLAGGNC